MSLPSPTKKDIPSHVEFELTNICQLSCIMCPHSIMERDKGYMSWGVFTKGIDEVRGSTKTSYLHQIGEPLLHPRLVDMVNYASDAGIRTSISTNCLLLNETMAEKILDSNLSEITLCLDSLNPKVYEEIRKGSNFQKVITNISGFLLKKRLKKSKIHVQVQMIKMQENKSEWGNFSFEGADEIVVKNYSTFAGNVVKGEQENKYRLWCKKLFECLTVQWNGDIVICCRDFNGVTKVGNILTDSIKDVWNGEQYRALRQAFIYKDFSKIPFCQKC